MKFPIINDDPCPSPSGVPASCGVDSLTGDLRLVLKPEVATICAPGFLQFETYLASGVGETRLIDALTYSSSDPTLLAIDTHGGGASLLAAGIVTVTVTWGAYRAVAQITLGGGDTCCDLMEVDTVLLQDTSKSMSQAFDSSYGTKGKLADALARAHVAVLNPKDKLAIVTFDEAQQLKVDFLSDSADILSQMTYPLWTTRGTDIKAAIEYGMSLLTAGDRKVMLLITDGVSPITSDDKSTLVLETDAFKAGGGILIIAGIRAYGAGFSLLQRLASPGFFLNVINPCQLEDALKSIAAFPSYYCGGLCVTLDNGYGYGGYCTGVPPLAQDVDPQPPPDIESGASGAVLDNLCGLSGQLDELSWRMPCVGGGPTANTCTCADPGDQVAIAQGNSGQTYSVVLRVRGLVEGKPYAGYGASGSTAGHVFTPTSPTQSIPVLPAHPENEYALIVSDPPATYLLNARGTSPTGSEVLDYNFTIQVKTGARVTLKARSIDRLQFKNISNLSVGGQPPPLTWADPYNGQALQINVVSIS